jgi:hypothetical protein
MENLSLSVEQQGYELILAALVELPLKAVPSRYRNQLVMNLQKQVQQQSQSKDSPDTSETNSEASPDSTNASPSSSTEKAGRTKKGRATSTPTGE